MTTFCARLQVARGQRGLEYQLESNRFTTGARLKFRKDDVDSSSTPAPHTVPVVAKHRGVETAKGGVRGTNAGIRH